MISHLFEGRHVINIQFDQKEIHLPLPPMSIVLYNMTTRTNIQQKCFFSYYYFLFLSLKNERTNRYSIYTKIMKRWKRPSSLYVQRVSISRNLTSTWPSGVDCFFHVLVDHISQNAFRTTASDLHTVYYTFCDTVCSQFKLSLSLS